MKDDIQELIIKILEDHGYEGLDALELLNQIYHIIQDRSFRDWNIFNIDDFLTLKDIVWYNWEYLEQNEMKLGLIDLKTMGSKFPNFMNLFSQNTMCEKYLLSDLSLELDTIISSWSSKSLYLIRIYTEFDINEPIILHKQGESPNKYCKDAIKRTSNILDVSGKNIIQEANDYAKAEMIGLLNDLEQSNIYYNLLIDLNNNVKQAIQYHKNLRVVINE